MSEKLAKIYNADIEKCKVAALLHDICKEMDMEYIKNICKNNFISELSEEDLEKIEAEMKKIVKENIKLEKYVLPRDEAIDYFRDVDKNKYKKEVIINEFKKIAENLFKKYIVLF